MPITPIHFEFTTQPTNLGGCDALAFPFKTTLYLPTYRQAVSSIIAVRLKLRSLHNKSVDTFFLLQIAPPTCSNVIKAFFYWYISFTAIFSETKSRPHILLVPKCLGCQIFITTNELIVAPNGTNPKKLNVHPACDGDRNLSSVYTLSLNDPLPVQPDYPKGLITPPNVSFLFHVGDS
ncbi:hypothetical protein JTE90_013444 [Oedothorax gibbosus]|uniref:Uncharacterized protein n=1 Tax=Oedothorax gibbosus TaxID=931172 RepID=A0AAV6VMD0_9ARAC|nr:hypothetical protein JTE90_013444 [Oedothorax gibbosus]